MVDFNFITIPELRACLESDYQEMRFCLDAKAWKGVHVLAGSIVEAVLLDALHSEPACQGKNLDKVEFAELIKLAHDNKVISDESERLSTVVRGYRNLIHPGRMKRLEKTPTEHGAVIASRVVEVMIDEVTRRKNKTYGMTADQLFYRCTSGDSALPVISLLIRDVRPEELVRLLSELLSTAIVNEALDPECDRGLLAHQCRVYNVILRSVDEDVRRQVTQGIAKAYREKVEDVVNVYEEKLFTCKLLKYMNDSDIQLVKTHLLSRLDDFGSDALFPPLVGIGPYLSKDEFHNCVVSICLIVQMGSNLSRSRSLVGHLFTDSSEDRKAAMIEWVEEFRGFWNKSEDDDSRRFDQVFSVLKREEARGTDVTN